MIHSIRTFSAILILGLFLVTSCKDNPASSTEEPPQIPSVQSMTVEMDQFENQDAQQKIQTNATLQSGTHFNHAALGALVSKVVVEANLIIPRVLLKAADSADVELNEDGQWVWEYSKTAGQKSYGVRLLATEQDNDQVQWDFYVTNSELEINDQLFFSGVASRDGSKGTWTYYFEHGNVSEDPVASVTWEVSSKDDVYLKLEVLSQQNEYFGDSIEYTFDGTIKYVTYFDSSEETTAEIRWNVKTHEGFLIAPDYNNGEKACWDSELQNTVCEES